MSSHRLLPSISFLNSNDKVSGGSDYPLGATFDGRGTNFALFSANASKVELCLFDSAGRQETARFALPERTDDVWHGYFPDVTPGQLYGYRVHGPYEPDAGHRFNPNKLLIDPYGKDLAGQFVWNDAHFGYRTGSKQQDLSYDKRDNARYMFKSVVLDDAHSWGKDSQPRVPWEQTLIYEAHVKGLTQTFPGIPEGMRGTYNALSSPAMIAHLRRLGVTAVELLPVHAFLDDRHLTDRGLRNYWGYNTLSFFTPERRYAHGNTNSSFRNTVAALHDAGIEVILDVVYNHTCEGNQLGPTFCFRGIDNASYYWLHPDNFRYYDDFTGTGNSLKLAHPRVLQMVMDSLRRWIDVYHVDGFRFDLASTLGRQPGFDANAPFFAAVRQDPVLSNVKLIAEPWDIGLGGYQVGGFPTGWSEWNDVYRNTMRRYWRGDGSLLGDVARCMTGSAPQYQHNGRGPRSSINHVTVHDGFTLNDLVSFESKHNEANGEDNRDGSDDNVSLNFGVEGPTDDVGINAMRRQLRRNQIACLMLAQGVPLLLAGDEAANTQGGNNNTYCQDNETGWIDWSKLETDDDLTDLVGTLKRMRGTYPQLQPHQWLIGQRENGSYDVKWLTPSASEMSDDDWNFPGGRFLSYVLAGRDDAARPLFIVLNAAHEEIEFTFPEWPNAGSWSLVLETSEHPSGTDGHPTGTSRAPRLSVLVYEGRP